jgi:hypothetical protein
MLHPDVGGRISLRLSVSLRIKTEIYSVYKKLGNHTVDAPISEECLFVEIKNHREDSLFTCCFIIFTLSKFCRP